MNCSQELPVIFLMGPTASGKTELAVELVQRLPLEIVSVDSALVYRGMDIGTAKPDAAVLERAPHRLINLLEPLEPYSAAQFCADARREIEQIHAAGRIPLLTGGTMLYYRALAQGLSDLPSANPEVRERIDQQAREQGWEALHRRLAQVDPQAAQRIHPNDPQRIQRALEVYEITGVNMTKSCAQSARAQFPWPLLKLALMPADRSLLHARIALRFRNMLALGLVEELEELLRRYPLTPDLPSMRTVGYRQVLNYLMGDLTYEGMVERGVIATRQLAKRQITWLRSETTLHTVPVEGADNLNKSLKLIEQFVG